MDDSDEATVSEDVVVIFAVAPLADEAEEPVDEAEEVEADVSAVMFACFSFAEQPAEISTHSANIKEILRFMVCSFPVLFKGAFVYKTRYFCKRLQFLVNFVPNYVKKLTLLEIFGKKHKIGC